MPDKCPRFPVPRFRPNPRSLIRHLSRALLILLAEVQLLSSSSSGAFTAMVQAIVFEVVVAESSETVFVEGNHYFPPESIKVVLTLSATT